VRGPRCGVTNRHALLSFSRISFWAWLTLLMSRHGVVQSDRPEDPLSSPVSPRLAFSLSVLSLDSRPASHNPRHRGRKRFCLIGRIATTARRHKRARVGGRVSARTSRAAPRDTGATGGLPADGRATELRDLAVAKTAGSGDRRRTRNPGGREGFRETSDRVARYPAGKCHPTDFVECPRSPTGRWFRCVAWQRFWSC